MGGLKRREESFFAFLERRALFGDVVFGLATVESAAVILPKGRDGNDGTRHPKYYLPPPPRFPDVLALPPLEAWPPEFFPFEPSPPLPGEAALPPLFALFPFA